MLNIVQQLFLNEAGLAENHLIQPWLKKWLNMPIQIYLPFKTVYLAMKYHYLIVEILSSMKYLKFVENLGRKIMLVHRT